MARGGCRACEGELAEEEQSLSRRGAEVRRENQERIFRAKTLRDAKGAQKKTKKEFFAQRHREAQRRPRKKFSRNDATGATQEK